LAGSRHARAALEREPRGAYDEALEASMKTHINFRNIQPTSHESLQHIIDELAKGRIERYLTRRADPDAIELHAHLEKSGHRDHYQVGLQLGVPGTTLASKAEDWELAVALRRAFDELEREVMKYKGD
jgi:ribosome-associated translation inhibitor RaiA